LTNLKFRIVFFRAEGVVKALQTLTEPARRDPEDLKMTTDTTESILDPSV